MYTFDIELKKSWNLTAQDCSEIIALCTLAFNRDYTPYMKSFQNPAHILGRCDGKLVTHVLWITRWLQIDKKPLLRTAYLEALATHPDYRNQGFASEVMRKASCSIHDYDIGALSTGLPEFYARLGWQLWKGPLYARKEKELVPVPGEQGCVMVLSLPKTPPFDINSPLSIEWRELEPW